jgi:hypothetical protein
LRRGFFPGFFLAAAIGSRTPPKTVPNAVRPRTMWRRVRLPLKERAKVSKRFASTVSPHSLRKSIDSPGASGFVAS